MTVHIREVNVKRIGPLTEFHMELGLVNLIYGRNEQGKTHLVEFIIQSMFKKPGFDYLRPLTAQGEVLVTGIDASPLSFSMRPRSKKLEDYLVSGKNDLPPSLGRLLVVRAGELALARSETDGVNRQILKEYLSNDGFLDKIQTNISRTIQAAQLGSTGEIMGRSTGEIKEKDDLRNQLQGMDDLYNRLKEVYSGGNRALLKRKIDMVSQSLEQFEKARKHKAWTLYEEIQKLERELALLPRDVLEKIQSDVRQFEEKESSLAEKHLRQQVKETTSTHYPWLVEAIDVYKNTGTQQINQPGLIYLILAGLCLLATIAFSFIRIPLGTLLASVIAGVLVWLHFAKTKGVISHAADLKERDNILSEYAIRFENSCDGLAGLEVMRKKLEPEFIAAKLLDEEAKNDTVQLDALKTSIQAQIFLLVDINIDPPNWNNFLSQAKSQIIKMESLRLSADRELSRLNLSPDAYLSQDPGIEFDQEIYIRLKQEFQDLSENLKRETAVLDDLKADICRKTGDSLSTDWDILIGKLQTKRSVCASDYKKISAKITAQILVNQALNSFRQQEELHILEGLRSPLVSEPLRRLTGQYEYLDLENGKIQVHDRFSAFQLADLSTGAQEQVLLAMRIGFAQKLMEKDSLFLVLDDAFQHSDWERRVRLVDEMVGLAQQGWQIIYFTMDDHIRGLFDDRVKHIFGDQYCYRELSQKPV